MLIYVLLCELILPFLEFQPKTKSKQKCCLVLPGYVQKAKKAIDFLLKKTVAKFADRSKKIAKLATDINICFVLENEHNFKSYSLRLKSLK